MISKWFLGFILANILLGSTCIEGRPYFSSSTLSVANTVGELKGLNEAVSGVSEKSYLISLIDFLCRVFVTELVTATVIVPVPSLMSLSHRSAEADEITDAKFPGFSS